MIVEDILNLIKEKRNNAVLDYQRTLKELNDKDSKQCNDIEEYMLLVFSLNRLQGTIETYDDLICHIESNMNKEDNIEELKELRRDINERISAYNGKSN